MGDYADLGLGFPGPNPLRRRFQPVVFAVNSVPQVRLRPDGPEKASLHGPMGSCTSSEGRMLPAQGRKGSTARRFASRLPGMDKNHWFCWEMQADLVTMRMGRDGMPEHKSNSVLKKCFASGSESTSTGPNDFFNGLLTCGAGQPSAWASAWSYRRSFNLITEVTV